MGLNNLHQWYPPVKYWFYPIYKFFRKKLGLNMYASNLSTFGVSAILHGGIHVPSEDYADASICGGLFILLGIASTTEKYLQMKKRKNKLELINKTSLEDLLN